MSNSKHYLLSFTTLFYNKKGYVFRFNRHQNVPNLDVVPLAFDPWNRYSALALDDMKMGTKVKRAAGAMHSILADYKTIFEGPNLNLEKGSLIYIAEVGAALTRGDKNARQGNLIEITENKDFYAYFGEVISQINTNLVKKLNKYDLKSSKKSMIHTEIPFKFKSSNKRVYSERNTYDFGFLKELIGENISLELLELLPSFGHNQVKELADILFKSGQINTEERLLTLQYGEKVVEIAKANFLKVVWDALYSQLDKGNKLSEFGKEPNKIENFKVIFTSYPDEGILKGKDTPIQGVLNLGDIGESYKGILGFLEKHEMSNGNKLLSSKVTNTETGSLIALEGNVSQDSRGNYHLYGLVPFDVYEAYIEPKIYEGVSHIASLSEASEVYRLMNQKASLDETRNVHDVIIQGLGAGKNISDVRVDSMTVPRANVNYTLNDSSQYIGSTSFKSVKQLIHRIEDSRSYQYTKNSEKFIIADKYKNVQNSLSGFELGQVYNSGSDSPNMEKTQSKSFKYGFEDSILNSNFSSHYQANVTNSLDSTEFIREAERLNLLSGDKNYQVGEKVVINSGETFQIQNGHLNNLENGSNRYAFKGELIVIEQAFSNENMIDVELNELNTMQTHSLLKDAKIDGFSSSVLEQCEEVVVTYAVKKSEKKKTNEAKIEQNVSVKNSVADYEVTIENDIKYHLDKEFDTLISTTTLSDHREIVVDISNDYGDFGEIEKNLELYVEEQSVVNKPEKNMEIQQDILINSKLEKIFESYIQDSNIVNQLKQEQEQEINLVNFLDAKSEKVLNTDVSTNMIADEIQRDEKAHVDNLIGLELENTVETYIQNNDSAALAEREEELNEIYLIDAVLDNTRDFYLLGSNRANQTDHKEQVYIEKLVSSKHEKILETYVQSGNMAEQNENRKETLETYVQNSNKAKRMNEEELHVEKLLSTNLEKTLEMYAQSGEIAEQIEYEEETAVEKLLGMNLEDTLEIHMQSMDRLDQLQREEELHVDKPLSMNLEKTLETYAQSGEIAEQIEREEETTVEKFLGMNLEDTLETYVQSMDRLDQLQREEELHVDKPLSINLEKTLETHVQKGEIAEQIEREEELHFDKLLDMNLEDTLEVYMQSDDRAFQNLREEENYLINLSTANSDGISDSVVYKENTMSNMAEIDNGILLDYVSEGIVGETYETLIQDVENALSGSEVHVAVERKHLAHLFNIFDIEMNNQVLTNVGKEKDATIEDTVSGNQTNEIGVVVTDGALMSLEDTYESIIDPTIKGEMGATIDTVVIDANLADYHASNEVDIATIEFVNSGNDRETTLEEIEFTGSESNFETTINHYDFASNSQETDSIINNNEMAISGIHVDTDVEESTLAECNVFLDVNEEKFDKTILRKNRKMTIEDEMQTEQVNKKKIRIFQEEEGSSSNATIMILDEEKQININSASNITIDSENTTRKLISNTMTIEDEELLNNHKENYGFIDEIDEGMLSNSNIISIENEFDLNIERQHEMNVIDEDDTGIGLPEPDKPWDEKEKDKVWLIMGKPFPAWNGWNIKKTR
ncbi:hypothetical protein ACQVQY_27825 [Bacillus mycoides]|uniref:hypothetical protein n=1 Tax=Bacillus mycoides TaxID=1405 RepID=UPI003D657E55